MVNLSNLTVFNMLDSNMQYLSAKQRVIAENIANASTPGYIAKTVEQPYFLSNSAVGTAVLANELRTTNEKHYNSLKSKSLRNVKNAYRAYTKKPNEALTIDGNRVIVEEQLNEASKNSVEYKNMIAIYNRYKNMIAIANTKING